MSTSIVDLIGTLIDSTRETATISNFSHTGSIYTAYTLDTGSLIVGDFVTISGNEYKILSVNTDSFFTFSSSINVIGTKWTSCAPYYFYGMPIHVSNSLDRITDWQNKYPIIYLMETISTTVNDDENSLIERTADLEMYFMDSANYVDWDMEQYHTLVIKKMQLIVDAFIEACENSHRIGSLTTHKEVNHPKWNLVRMDSGKNVFNATLSGIQLNISLPIKRLLEC